MFIVLTTDESALENYILYILFMTRSPAALLITTMPVVDATKAS